MASSEGLKELYIDELRDLWSANDQMQRLVGELTGKASDQTLRTLLEKSEGGIGQHTKSIRALLEKTGGSVGKEHCRGMEGMVAEARKHVLEEQLEPAMRDLKIIAQYQRMSHYGLAGFGTAAAYAAALGRGEDASTLRQIVSDIYDADEYSTQLAAAAERAAAAH